MIELCAKFGPTARLKDSNEFGVALKSKPAARGQHIYVHFTPNPAFTRLGVIVPKRLLKFAVTRNAVKRVFRESFRYQRYHLTTGDFVVRLLRKPKYDSLNDLKTLLRAEADFLLRQANDRFQKKTP